MNDRDGRTTETLPDPLPSTRVLGDDAPIGGRLKSRPEDFLVDEIPLYEPCGEGEHIYLRIQKTGMAHVEVVSLLSHHYGVRESAIGFAGMKDRQAVTQQTFSVHLPGLETPGPPTHSRIQVLWTTRHTNKLRRGHLAGNRFAIRIRDVDPMRAPSVMRGLETLRRIGVPDFYGTQRFGYRGNNHRLGLLLLRDSWTELLAELLGARGSWFPDHQRERRERFDRGELDEAATAWGRADRAERAAINALRQGKSAEQAVRAIGHASLSFWVSALQSAVFNHVVDRRLRGVGIDRLIAGDLAFKHDSRACFAVSAEEADSDVIRERLERFEISPSGPLIGPEMTAPTGEPAGLEAEVCADFGIDASLFAHRAWGAEGARRPMRVQLANADVEAGTDEDGAYIRTVFDLPRGAYATVVLREILGDDGERLPATSDDGAAP